MCCSSLPGGSWNTRRDDTDNQNWLPGVHDLPSSVHAYRGIFRVREEGWCARDNGIKNHNWYFCSDDNDIIIIFAISYVIKVTKRNEQKKSISLK